MAAPGGYPKSKAVDAQVFLMGRERHVEGDIMGRQAGDAERLFPKFTHASAATAGEVNVNGKVLRLWTYSQLETLSQSALRQRAMAIKDALGEAQCPPLPSGRCDDLVRWILQIQETLTCERHQEGRSGGYGTGHLVPHSFTQETEEIAKKATTSSEQIPFGSRPVPALDATRDHYRDLKFQQNEFKEDPNLGIQSRRVGGEGRKHIFPKQNMVTHGVSAADPQGIETLKDTKEGRRYIPCADSIMEQKQENEARQRPGFTSGPAARPAPRTAAGGPSHHVSETKMSYFGCTDADEAPIGGERKRHNHIPQDHHVGHATFDGQEDIHGRKYMDGFDPSKTVSHAGRQDAYKSNWKKNPQKLLGSSMII